MWFSVRSMKYKKRNGVAQHAAGNFIRVVFDTVVALYLTGGANIRPL